ncbi:FAD-dependent monooxygenase [Streptomyces sp. ST2-7A]|uniref:FAD-dependent oxidoreductase n=1 Tax=Streptomyces sp. ST2-7A TaxID=2907214 RepID=UPI001F215166|nr:FAD-dependent monooxygenase [Streptomyces sp. ST2-7A]MCE7079519.1 FAD-dependent monooxygenase [Streptomyces sp. ST2-7A]
MNDRILIAGGGIAGPATAVALGRRGLRVTVVERAPAIAAVGSGLVLYPNGMRAVDALGEDIGALVRAAGHVVGPGESRLILGASGELLTEEPIGEVPARLGSPQVSLLRGTLQDILWREARRAGAEVLLGGSVIGYAPAPEGVRLLLSGGEEVRGAALVGADGLWSPTRGRMLGVRPPLYRGYTSVRGQTDRSPFGTRSVVLNGRGAQIFVAPVGDGKVYWTAKITADEGMWPALSRRAAMERLLSLTRAWSGPAADLVRSSDPEDLTVTDIHDRDPVRQWTDGPVVLVGDAAHPMVPALGQGANLALEDAVVLGSVLGGKDTLRDMPRAMRRFARLRVPRAERVVLASRAQGSMDQGDGDREAARRDERTRRSGRKDAPVTDVWDWRPET